MVSQLYQLGLLLVVFGGFVVLASSGLIARFAVVAMILGFALGCIGVLGDGVGRE
ncbi:hypothetical protein [Haloarchaeobius sp. DFWS5]|uniref:hypothetical protein n=1 Tax=Haloarchaeobius sp. DFWS5 TaxID=3446114 RepID=UPI003EBC270D